jgi:hypothetical protein
LIEQAIKAYGKIDLLILNAGVSFHAPLESVSDITLYLQQYSIGDSVDSELTRGVIFIGESTVFETWLQWKILLNLSGQSIMQQSPL